MRRLLNGLLAALFLGAKAGIGAAAAETYAIPAPRPIATIEIPDDWHVERTRDGVEGSVNDGAVRLAVRFIPASDWGAATTTMLGELAQRGVILAPDTRRSAAQRYGGLDALKIDYSGRDANGESDITLILVAMPEKSGIVAVCYWGDDEAQESVGNDLQSIAESLLPAKKFGAQ